MSVAPQQGEPAPDFSLPSTAGVLRLSDLNRKGKVVLVFYTEDATPLCTSELTSFRDDFQTLRDLGAYVVGISADSLDSHRKFADSLGGLPFTLASDTSLAVAKLYGVAAEGDKRSRRAVFVIDKSGVITHANTFYNPGNPSQYAEVFQALGLKM